MATLRSHGINDYIHLGRKVCLQSASLPAPFCFFTFSHFLSGRSALTTARKLRSSDFDNFDYIFAMDKSNLSDVQREQRKKAGGGKAKVMLFGEYSGTGKVEIVDDPYYGGSAGFETAYEQACRFTRNFLRGVFPDVKGGV